MPRNIVAWLGFRDVAVFGGSVVAVVVVVVVVEDIAQRDAERRGRAGEQESKWWNEQLDLTKSHTCQAIACGADRYNKRRVQVQW